MKYSSNMKECHNEILAAIQRMCGDDTKITENFSPNDGSLAPLRDYIKQKHGKPYHGFGSSELYVDCHPTKGMTIESAGIVEMLGEKLEMSWSQVTKFIRNNWDDVFCKESPENQPSLAAENPAKADKPKLTYKDVLLEHYPNFDERRFEAFAFCTCITDYFGSGTNDCTKHDNCKNHWESQCESNWNPCSEADDYIKKYLVLAKNTATEKSGDEPPKKMSKMCQELFASNADTDNKTADVPNPPVPAEETTTLFDYSELDGDTAQNLRECENVIRQKTAGYFTLLGEKFKEAQTLLANHSSGTFEKWYTALGFKRQTVYNLIQRYDFLSSPALEGREDTFEALPLTLSYEVSKPDAPKELVEKVIEGDITTNAEYIKLKKELEATLERSKAAQGEYEDLYDRHAKEVGLRSELEQRISELENRPLEAEIKKYKQQLNEANRRTEEAEMQARTYQHNYFQANKNFDMMCEDNVKLEERIKELEARPIEVAVQQDESVLEELELLREENARLKDTNIKNMIIRITLDDFDAMLNALKDKPHLRGIIAKAEILKV